MNKEQQEILDDAFSQFRKYKMENLYDIRWDVIIEMNTSDNTKPYFATGRRLSQEEFINKCKTDSEFSEKWGLKIEERELNRSERYTIARQYGLCPKYSNIGIENCTEEEHYNKYNVPTKLITITYNDKTIESYE
jgi:hypothetical protein